MTTELPLRPGTTGDAVRDVQRRLAAQGLEAAGDPPGTYGDATRAAVLAFQERRGLRADGICGAQTWASLVEAGHRLGDRLLYLHQPMLRGDDVAELQRELGLLGFDAGRVDGIYGPATATAVDQFQRNAGVTTDGICGPDTVSALRRVLRAEGGTTVAHVCGRAAYYAATGFESPGGRRLASLIVEEVEAAGMAPVAAPVGMRLPVLRETRMPAVLCELGPPTGVVERTGELAAALVRACARWASEPPDTP